MSMTTTGTNQCYSIDVLKVLLAFLVVCIHFKPVVPYQYCIDPLTRCAVPTFFIISGYFLAERQMTERYTKSIRRILKIILWSSVFYAIVMLLRWLLTRQFDADLNPLHIILFNVNPFASHLWYLQAYLYVLCMMLLLSNKRNYFRFLPWLIIGALALGTYRFLFTDNYISNCLARNFIFEGLPCFGIGLLLARKDRENIIKSRKCIHIFLTISILASMFEGGVIHSFHIIPGDIYLTTLPLSVSLFLTFLTMPSTNTVLAKMGYRDSLYIYIFHFFLGNRVVHLIDRFQDTPSYAVLMVVLPVIVFFITEAVIVTVKAVAMKAASCLPIHNNR